MIHGPQPVRRSRPCCAASALRMGTAPFYHLTREGEKPTSWSVDRAGIAQCMADLIEDETRGVNESLGITN